MPHDQADQPDPLSSPPDVCPDDRHVTSRDFVLAALRGHAGPDAQRIAAVGLDWIAKILAKNKDYGGSVWKVPVLAPGQSPGEAIMVRMSDKIERIRQLRTIAAGPAVKTETLDDTVDDLGAYCILYRTRPPDARDELKIENMEKGRSPP